MCTTAFSQTCRHTIWAPLIYLGNHPSHPLQTHVLTTVPLSAVRLSFCSSCTWKGVSLPAMTEECAHQACWGGSNLHTYINMGSCWNLTQSRSAYTPGTCEHAYMLTHTFSLTRIHIQRLSPINMAISSDVSDALWCQPTRLQNARRHSQKIKIPEKLLARFCAMLSIRESFR